MRPRRRSQRQSSLTIWAGIVLFAAVLLAIGGGFFYLLYLSNRDHVELADDLCPVSGSRGQTIVLVDTTDAVGPFTQQEVQKRLADASQTLTKGQRFEIRVLESGENRTKTLFSLCNPGNGSDLNDITGNPRLALQKWRDGFEAPLTSALESAMGGAVADSSPIMAAIQAIAVERLTAKSERSVPSRLIFVSDMMENTEYFSIYRSGAKFDAFLKSAAAERFATDLAGAKVDILFVPRLELPVDSAQLMQFWATWIDHNKGKFGSAIRLQGAQ